jgi:hypothetical protein
MELVRLPAGEWIVSRLFELCELALEWPACRGILRMELTDEEVDFRPRSPAPEERRRDWLPRGVIGEGESEVRVAFEPDFWWLVAREISSLCTPLSWFADVTGVRVLPYEELRVRTVEAPEVARSWVGRSPGVRGW